MKKMTLAIALLGLISVSSCKKDDKKSSNTKEAKLTSGKWQLTASLYQQINNGVAGTEDDDFDEIEACEKDDFVLFTAEKNIVTDEGPTKCDPSDYQQTTQGTWSLIENDSKMRQSSFFGNVDWVIEQLDDNNLRISTTDVDGTITHKSTSVYKNIK
ncbi:MAG: lipocalin family protein [Bacteroidota bacterium]